MIESHPPEIKDQIKTLTLEARSKKIIKVLHDYLKQHHNHFLALYLDLPAMENPFYFLDSQLDSITLTIHVILT